MYSCCGAEMLFDRTTPTPEESRRPEIVPPLNRITPLSVDRKWPLVSFSSGSTLIEVLLVSLGWKDALFEGLLFWWLLLLLP